MALAACSDPVEKTGAFPSGHVFLFVALAPFVALRVINLFSPEFAAHFAARVDLFTEGVSAPGNGTFPGLLLARWSWMLFYPLTTFHYLSPESAPWLYFVLLHGLAAAWGMYVLAWRFSRSPSRALVASIAFCAFLGVVGDVRLIAGLTWTPWLLALARAAFLNGGRSLVFFCAFAAVQFLSGVSEAILITWLLVATSVVTRLREGLMWSSARRITAAAVLTALFVATQVVPLMHLGYPAVRERPGWETDRDPASDEHPELVGGQAWLV